MDEILCGSSCVKYVLNEFGLLDEEINKNMKWITELAICLKEKNINSSILCFNSNLYYDYKYAKNIDKDFEGFRFIKDCVDLNIPIIEIKLTKKELLKEIRENTFVILCVQSALFNHNNMEGGHFIILNGMIDNKVKVINPTKNKYEFRNEDITDIINYCKYYGAWRILIKEAVL